MAASSYYTSEMFASNTMYYIGAISNIFQDASVWTFFKNKPTLICKDISKEFIFFVLMSTLIRSRDSFYDEKPIKWINQRLKP